eukprot:12147800-Alexandrium_andersonii.AAC.1
MHAEWEAELHACVLQAREVLDGFSDTLFPPQSRAYCHVHKGACLLHPESPDDKIEIDAAGTSCFDWSEYGNGSGLAGASALPFL